MFPNSFATLDPLRASSNTSVGAPNWVGPVNGNSVMLVMDANGLGARSTGVGVGAGSAWAVQAASFRAASVTLTRIPSSTNVVSVGALLPLNGSGGALYATYTNGSPFLTINSGFTNSSAVISPADGDSFACTYDPSTDQAAVWYLAVGTSLWVQKATITAGYTLGVFARCQGWYPWVECDNTTVRISNFSADLMPGSDAWAPHPRGRGAI